jgi:hypothetical protein
MIGALLLIGLIGYWVWTILFGGPKFGVVSYVIPALVTVGVFVIIFYIGGL